MSREEMFEKLVFYVESDYNQYAFDFDNQIALLLKRPEREDLTVLLRLFLINEDQDDMLMSLIPTVEYYSELYGSEFYINSLIQVALELENFQNEYITLLFRRTFNDKKDNLILLNSIKSLDEKTILRKMRAYFN